MEDKSVQTQTSSFLPQFLEACKKKLDPFAGQTISAETQHLKRGGRKWKGGRERERRKEKRRGTKTRIGTKRRGSRVEKGNGEGGIEGGRRRKRMMMMRRRRRTRKKRKMRTRTRTRSMSLCIATGGSRK